MADNQRIDYGQAQIQTFANAVAAGQVHFDPKAAQDAANLYEQAIAELLSIKKALGEIPGYRGFGGFRTGAELQQGFSRKATDGVAVVDQLIEGAMHLQETYLRAGNLIEQADQVNRSRIASASNRTGGGQA
ncbi:MAG: hypothetical protein J2P18_04655 [Nocardia sp.]|nr:hypothetical protein [Nocardia sp.]